MTNLEAMPVNSPAEFMAYYEAWKRRRNENHSARERFRVKRFWVRVRLAMKAGRK